jgi:hypothetical protein
MMELTGVEDDEDTIGEVGEADSSSTIILSFFFNECTNRTATNVALLNRCCSYAIYNTKMHIYLPLLTYLLN